MRGLPSLRSSRQNPRASGGGAATASPARRDQLTSVPLASHCGGGEREERCGRLFRQAQPGAVLVRKARGAQARAQRAGIDEVGPHGGSRDFAGIDAHHRLERGLARGIGAPIGLELPRAAAQVTNMARPAGERRSSGSSARTRRQLAVRLTSITSCQTLGSKWPIGDSVPSTPAAPTSTSSRPKRAPKRRAQLLDLVEVAQIDRDERRGAARRADGIVGLFEPALRCAPAARHARPRRRAARPRPRRGRARRR